MVQTLGRCFFQGETLHSAPPEDSNGLFPTVA